VSPRANGKFKRDREDEDEPAVQPEVEPNTGGCTALSVAKGLVTEHILTLEIEGEECEFMVDTGAMVSLIQPGISKMKVQPCDVQARGITGT
jgi:predicted aspartyl protease